MSALQFDHVSIALGGRHILKDVSFAIEQGEFIGMLGANGAGKTTLMRATLGLIPLAAGKIAILEAGTSYGNAAIGYMPQNRGNFINLHLKGYDIIASAAGGGGWGLPRLDAATRKEIDWALDLVDARDLARLALNELSGGQRQRLLLSQALLGKPKLLLLDEPLISLDPSHQHGVVELVKRLRDELHLAIIFSAHELNPLINVIDRVLYLGGGNAALGTVDEVITGPVLSKLYGTEIEVVRIKNRVFVMAGDVEVERDAHLHEHEDAGHGHHHDHHNHGAHA
ncbi:metal ABC transporter ATP-binding protein [Methylovirgula sp. 4M-Z18]|uniref:metal ABC transporter ATP-binding protein n=1 Tax=Methylovirgula sp. 4M-Z18 TaxID=2293567 RepID=UPI000E2F75A7|nr:ATP-binding cassette domain-containing protein [Methylovirgula sp. 4M-Z18]RFB80532.1 ATP-binding cassette domain-containing protein [Methylovirgula sp. 4M-Z18]